MPSSIKKTIQKATSALPSLKSNDAYRWDELQKIEKRRRAILTCIEEPFWKVLLHWDGTVIRQISRDTLLWLTIGIYIAVRVQARLDLPAFVSDLANNNLTLIGGFLTFFLVFYVNQNHKRFFGLYGDSMACKGRIFDTATLAKAYLPPARAYRLLRYMNAAHAAGYVGLSKIYPAVSFFRHVNETCALLDETEMQRMNVMDLDKGGSCNRELIAWCMSDIHRMHKEGLIDNFLAQEFRTQVLQLRAKIGQLYNAADLPIPFFYLHFICLLTALYLPLFAVSAAYNAGTGQEVYWTADLMAGLVVLLQCIFVIGLRIVGQKMSDPYGDDLVDLSVMFYVDFTWTHSQRILNGSPPPALDEGLESLLQEKKKFIGEAWEHGEFSKAMTVNETERSSNGSTK